MRRGLCLAAVILVSFVPAVQARHDATKQAPDLTYAGQTEQGLPGFVKVLPHGAITAAFAYSTFCSAGDGSIVWSGVAKAKVKGGKFHYQRREDAKGPAITLDGHITKTGVNGTWHVHYSVRNQIGTTTDVCDSETVNWSFPRDGAGGQTSQGYPVALRLGTNAVKSLQFVTRIKCKSGDEYLIPSFYDTFPIAKGSFGRTITDTVPFTKGQQAKISIQLKGRKGRGVMHGSWQMTATFVDKDGKEIDTCDSGPLSWSVVP
jgi:hypothetical protein